MHLCIFILCLATTAYVNAEGNIFWRKQFFLQTDWAPYADDVINIDGAIKAIHQDTLDGKLPSFVMCPSVSPDSLPQQPSGSKTLYERAFELAKPHAKQYHSAVAQRFGLVINPRTFASLEQAQRHYKSVLGDAADTNDNAALFAFKSSFVAQDFAGPQLRYQGPPFDFLNAFAKGDIVPLQQDKYWWPWAEYVRNNKGTQQDWINFASHTYVLHNPVLCWSLLLTGRLTTKTSQMPSVILSPPQDNDKRSLLSMWSNKCIGACTYSLLAGKSDCSGKSFAHCKADCLANNECVGVFYSSSRMEGIWVTIKPSASDLRKADGEYDMYLERYKEDARGRAFANTASAPISQHEEAMDYHMIGDHTPGSSYKRPDECFAAGHHTCYVNEDGWVANPVPGVEYPRQYVRYGEITPGLCEAKCFANEQCYAWTWKDNKCIITTGFGQMTTALADANTDVMKALDLDPSKSCNGTNQAHDVCLDRCVDIRKPLQMGWCNKQWVNCVNHQGGDTLPSVPDPYEKAVISMWHDTGCTTDELPMDLMGRYISNLTSGQTSKIEAVTAEIYQWCKCAQIRGTKLTIEGTRLGLNKLYDICLEPYTVTDEEMNRACAPKPTCTRVNGADYNITDDLSTIPQYKSTKSDMKICVGGAMENQLLAKANDLDPTFNQEGFLSHMGHSRQDITIDGIKGAYESETCGNIGAGVIHGNGELDRWVAWSNREGGTNRKHMPSNDILTGENNDGTTAEKCRIPSDERIPCNPQELLQEGKQCCTLGTESYYPRSPLRLASFDTTTFVTAGDGSEYASITSLDDCVGTACTHANCGHSIENFKPNRLNGALNVPECLILSKLRKTLEEAGSLVSTPGAVSPTISARTDSQIDVQCRSTFGASWSQGNNEDSYAGNGRQDGKCPPYACTNDLIRYFNKRTRKFNQPLTDCRALLSGTAFVGAQLNTQDDEEFAFNKQVATFLQAMANTSTPLPPSLARLMLSPESTSCLKSINNHWEKEVYDKLISSSASQSISNIAVKSGSSSTTFQNTELAWKSSNSNNAFTLKRPMLSTAQTKFTNLNPKTLNNKELTATYLDAYEDTTRNVIKPPWRSPMPHESHYAEKINTAEFAEEEKEQYTQSYFNSAFFGLMCPIGLENHAMAQLTMKCPASRPIRCSHATIVNPAGGTCAISKDTGSPHDWYLNDVGSKYADTSIVVRTDYIEETCFEDNFGITAEMDENTARKKEKDCKDAWLAYRNANGVKHDNCEDRDESSYFFGSTLGLRGNPKTARYTNACIMHSYRNKKIRRSSSSTAAKCGISIQSNIVSKSNADKQPKAIASTAKACEFLKKRFPEDYVDVERPEYSCAGPQLLLIEGASCSGGGDLTVKHTKKYLTECQRMCLKDSNCNVVSFKSTSVSGDYGDCFLRPVTDAAPAPAPNSGGGCGETVWKKAEPNYTERFWKIRFMKCLLRSPYPVTVIEQWHYLQKLLLAIEGNCDTDYKYQWRNNAGVRMLYPGPGSQEYTCRRNKQSYLRLEDTRYPAFFLRTFTITEVWVPYDDNTLIRTHFNDGVESKESKVFDMDFATGYTWTYDKTENLKLLQSRRPDAVITGSTVDDRYEVMFNNLKEKVEQCRSPTPCASWNDVQNTRSEVKDAFANDVSEYVTKIRQHSPCNVYDMSCHSIEDAEDMDVCGKPTNVNGDTTIQPLAGVQCGTLPYDGLTGGFCGVHKHESEEQLEMTSAEDAHATCAVWPTGTERICEQGYALVWIDGKPMCQMATAVSKETSPRGTKMPQMEVRKDSFDAPTYYKSSHCQSTEAATAGGTCVAKICAQRTTQELCEVQDLRYSTNENLNSCKWNANAECENVFSQSVEQVDDLWWPGFIREEGSFAGVGPAYMNQFDTCSDTRNGCQGFTLCGGNYTETCNDGSINTAVKSSCCNDVGDPDITFHTANGKEVCRATPSTRCAGGDSLYYMDPNALTSTEDRQIKCQDDGDALTLHSSTGTTSGCHCCTPKCNNTVDVASQSSLYMLQQTANSTAGYTNTIQELFLSFYDQTTYQEIDAQACLGAGQRLSGGLYIDGVPSCACKPNPVYKKHELATVTAEDSYTFPHELRGIGECLNNQKLQFKGDGDNDGSDSEKIFKCAFSCSQDILAKSQYSGFTIKLSTGRCFCEQGCTTLQDTGGSGDYSRFDFVIPYANRNGVPPTLNARQPVHYYSLRGRGECEGPELLMYRGDGDNDGSDAKKIARCAERCRSKDTTYSDSDKIKDKPASWDDFNLDGFIVKLSNGRCYCEQPCPTLSPSLYADGSYYLRYSFSPEAPATVNSKFSSNFIEQECGNNCAAHSTHPPIIYTHENIAPNVHYTFLPSQSMIMNMPHSERENTLQSSVCSPVQSCAYTQPDHMVHSFVTSGEFAETSPSLCRQLQTFKAAQEWCISKSTRCVGLVISNKQVCLAMVDDDVFQVNPLLPGSLYRRYSAAKYKVDWNASHTENIDGVLLQSQQVLYDPNSAVAVCESNALCTGMYYFRNGSFSIVENKTVDNETMQFSFLPEQKLWSAKMTARTTSCPPAHPYVVDDACCTSPQSKPEECVPCTQCHDSVNATRCPAHKLCANGKSVLNKQTMQCQCVCNAFYTGPLCDRCSRSNTKPDCKTCKDGFKPGEGDTCICRKGFDIKSNCTTCLPGFKGNDCDVDSCSFQWDTSPPHVSLDNVVIAHNDNRMLYDGVYAAGHGKVPYSMQNSFVVQDGRMFWLYQASRVEIGARNLCFMWNNATWDESGSCTHGYYKNQHGIHDCRSNVLVAARPHVCADCTFTSDQAVFDLPAPNTVLGQCQKGTSDATMALDDFVAEPRDTQLGSCDGACSAEGQQCLQTGQMHCCYNDQWNVGACDQQDIDFATITHHTSGNWLYSIPRRSEYDTFVTDTFIQKMWSATGCSTDVPSAFTVTDYLESEDRQEYLNKYMDQFYQACILNDPMCVGNETAVECNKQVAAVAEADEKCSITHNCNTTDLLPCQQAAHLAAKAGFQKYSFGQDSTLCTGPLHTDVRRSGAKGLLVTRKSLIRDTQTWGARCWVNRTNSNQAAIVPGFEDYDSDDMILQMTHTSRATECAEACYASSTCSAFVWQSSICRLIKPDQRLRSAEYLVDPQNCVSGGYWGTGRWRNLPNRPELAVPEASELLIKVPAHLNNRLVCGYGTDTVFLLTEYRRHPWTGIPCNHVHVAHVHAAWLDSLPRGKPLSIEDSREGHGTWQLVQGADIMPVSSTVTCGEYCKSKEQCFGWYQQYNGSCVVSLASLASVPNSELVRPAFSGGYLLHHDAEASPKPYTTPVQSVAVAHVQPVPYTADSKQECCTKCSAHGAWRLAGAQCYCYEVEMSGYDECWVDTIPPDDTPCQARVTMSKELNVEPTNALLWQVVPRLTSTKQCSDACAQEVLCWIALWRSNNQCDLYQRPQTMPAQTQIVVGSVMYTKKGGCILQNGMCTYSLAPVPIGTTQSGACTANGASMAQEANAKLYYLNHTAQTLQAQIDDECQDQSAQLYPRALAPILDARLKAVDAELLFDRMDRIKLAWDTQKNPVLDGLGGSAYTDRPDKIQSYQVQMNADTLPVAEGDDPAVYLRPNTEDHVMNVVQMWSPSPRENVTAACREQASLASLAVGMSKTAVTEQCYAVGSCVPPAKDTGALNNVYNAYVQQLKACLAAEYSDSEKPVPVAIVLQPGTKFVQSEYQNLPVYVNLEAKNYARFGSRNSKVSELLPLPTFPTPQPSTFATPSPVPSFSDRPIAVADSCTFSVYANMKLAQDVYWQTTRINSTAYQANESIEKCREICAKLLACRMFLFDETTQTCEMHSINKVGCAVQQNTECDIWVDSAENNCRVTVSSDHFAVQIATQTEIKEDCCIIDI